MNRTGKGCFQKGYIPWIKGKTKLTEPRLVCSLETKNKMHISHLGKKHSVKKFFNEGQFKKGEHPWNYGLTKEIDERIAKYTQKGGFSRRGIKQSKEHRNKLKLSHIGHPCYNSRGRGKCGIRKDLNQFFRSTWEANFARILNHLKIKWEYEMHRIFLETCSYLPDFYLPELNLFIEVKGTRFGNRDEKLELLYKELPSFPIKIIDGVVYELLKKRYSKIIVGWEK